MTKKDKKALVTQNANLAGKPIADIVADLTAANQNLTPEDALEIAEAINGSAPPPPPAGNQPPPPDGVPQTTDVNQTFEIWTVEPTYKEHPAERGSKAWRELTGFDKVRKIKDTRIAPDRAELLNQQSENTRERYYLAGQE